MTQEFKDHIVQHPNRFKRVPVAGTTDQFDLIPTWQENPSEVVQLGTPIDRQLFEGITSQLAETETQLSQQIEVARTERINESRIGLNSLSSSKLKITADADRIKLVNLSDEVLQAMAGNTPVNATPTANSVTTEKVADGAVTLPKTDLPISYVQSYDNFYDKYTAEIGKAISLEDGSLYTATSMMTNIIPIDGNYIKLGGQITSNNPIARYRFLDNAFGVVSFGSGARPLNIPNNNAIAYLQIQTDANRYHDLMIVPGNVVPTTYKPYHKINGDSVKKANYEVIPWKGKVLSTFGDSITAQGQDGTGYQQHIVSLHEFSGNLVRGIGGSRYRWSTQLFWANPDGSYAGRPDAGGSQPAGTTEHNATFCSWDRIKAMYPDSIRNTIDLVVCMGGTNDWQYITSSNIGNFSYGTGNTTDAAWVAEAGFNGDFNLNTLKGAIASTVLKLQKRCPNALIVLASPLSGRGTTGQSGVEQVKNAEGYTTEDVAKIVEEVAHYFSIPFIDVFGKTGINQMNRLTYIADSVHPNETGEKRLGEVMAHELKAIPPR